MIDTTDLRAKIARQLDLEDESRTLGAERYRAQRALPWRTDPSMVVEEAELPPGRQLIRQVIPPTVEALEEFLARMNRAGAGRRHVAAKLLSQVESEAAAYLAARIVVNGAVLGNAVQTVAFEIADAIVHHIEMTALKQRNKDGYNGLLKAQKKQGYSSKKRDALKKIMDNEGARYIPDQSERLQAGMKMLELICETTGLFMAEPDLTKRGMLIVRPTEACRDWFERQHARCEVLEPIHLPMVVRPRNWKTPFWGGYLTKRPGLRLVKQWNGPYHEELRHIEMPEVFEAVNNIQSVPWRINRTVLDVMRQVWDGGGSLGGLPRRDDLELPPKPENIDTDEEALKKWKAEAAQVYTQNAQLLSKRLAISQRLWIAQKFVDEEAIYFPHDLDFRGRIYPIPVGGPHPQGDDSGKALLEFSEGMPLGEDGPGWLAVHVANLFGIDKVPFEERVDWVMQHTDQILDSAENPLDGARFWTTADSPYCALAACIEWAGYCREGSAYVSRVPVALDGSNSGLQHFSAMLRDPVGAAAVNLTPGERPADVYRQVAAKAQAFVDADGSPEALPWKDGKISRNIAKRPTMTYCYSATRFGMQGMVLQALRDADKAAEYLGKPPYLGGADNYKAAMYLSHVLWDAISEVVSAASSAMAWLREAAKIAAELGLPIWWTTPMGMPVLQAYRTVHAQRVKVHFGGKVIRVTMAVDGDEIDKRGQANGIAPNFVHSNDAAHLQSVVNACVRQGITALALIHDSFGTHAANAGRLSMILRETFVEQYTPDRLREFRDELAAQLPKELADKLPPLPELGTLDLKQVLDSPYVFA